MNMTKKKENYSAPATVIHPFLPSSRVMQDQSLPVNPGEEGDQEQAETKDVEWGTLWEDGGLWGKGDLWEDRSLF